MTKHGAWIGGVECVPSSNKTGVYGIRVMEDYLYLINLP